MYVQWSCGPFVKEFKHGQVWSSASPRGQWRAGKNGETGCKIICGAPTTLAVKGLMVMMTVRSKKKASVYFFLAISHSL